MTETTGHAHGHQLVAEPGHHAGRFARRAIVITGLAFVGIFGFATAASASDGNEAPPTNSLVAEVTGPDAGASANSHGNADHGNVDHGNVDHGSADNGSADNGSADHRGTDQRSHDSDATKSPSSPSARDHSGEHRTTSSNQTNSRDVEAIRADTNDTPAKQGLVITRDPASTENPVSTQGGEAATDAEPLPHTTPVSPDTVIAPKAVSRDTAVGPESGSAGPGSATQFETSSTPNRGLGLGLGLAGRSDRIRPHGITTSSLRGKAFRPDINAVPAEPNSLAIQGGDAPTGVREQTPARSPLAPHGPGFSAPRDVTPESIRPTLTSRGVTTSAPPNGAAQAEAQTAVAQILAPVTQVLAPVTQVVAQTVAPVRQVLAPVTQALGPVTQILTPVLAPVAQALAPVTEPVTEVLAPVLAPVAQSLAPVTQALAPVLEQTVAPVLAPVAEGIAPVTEALHPAVTPLTQTVMQLTSPAVTDVTYRQGYTLSLGWSTQPSTSAVPASAVIANWPPQSTSASTLTAPSSGAYASSVDGLSTLADAAEGASPEEGTQPGVPAPGSDLAPVSGGTATGTGSAAGSGGVGPAYVTDFKLPASSACGWDLARGWRLPGSLISDPGCSPD